MKKKLFVHIGTHKTGTTSFQDFIRANETVFEKNGLYIPKAGTISTSSGHHNLAWQFNKDPRYCQAFGNVNTFVDELRSCSQSMALISSEDFEYLVDKTDGFRQFDLSLATIGWQVVYIVFLRNQPDYFISLYFELLSHGMKLTKKKMLLQLFNNGKLYQNGWSFYFDYNQFIKKLYSATNSEIRIFSYDRSRARNTLAYDIISNALPAERIKSELTDFHYLNVNSHHPKNQLLWAIIRGIVRLRFYRSNLLVTKKYNISLNRWSTDEAIPHKRINFDQQHTADVNWLKESA